MWNELEICDFGVNGKYDGEGHAPVVDEEQMSRHYIRSEYEFQASRCTGTSIEKDGCCEDLRSKWLSMFPHGFLPADRVFVHREGKLHLANPLKIPKKAPFADLNETLARPLKDEICADLYNPKVTRRQIYLILKQNLFNSL